MFNIHLIAFVAVLITCWIPDTVSYSKYGRTCKDIGCRSNEVCIMMEDPCTGYAQDRCGRYPTCKKSHAGDVSCTSMVCSENNYCKVENGVPKCVSKITSNVPSGPDSRQRYPVVRPTPPPVPPRRPSSGRAGSRNTIGDNSIWYRLFGGDRDQGSDGGRSRPATDQQTGYYNTHSSTDSRGNRIWTFSG